MSKNNVYAIFGADLPPDQVLRKAIEADLSGVVVIGWVKQPQDDGRRFYVASSYGTDEAVVYALQHANRLVLDCSGD